MNINLEIDLKLEKSTFFSPSRQQKHGDDTLEAALPAFLGERMRDKARRLLRLCIRHNFDLMMTPPGRSHHSYNILHAFSWLQTSSGLLATSYKSVRETEPRSPGSCPSRHTTLRPSASSRVSHPHTPSRFLLQRTYRSILQFGSRLGFGRMR